MQKLIDGELATLIDTLPEHIRDPLFERDDLTELLEVVLDFGREPEARLLDKSFIIIPQEVTLEDIDHVIKGISPFGLDNRSGIERTLHRISAIRNRSGKVIGLTLRVGRAVYGTIRIIEDLVLSGKSVLLLGKPGVGKTTMLREVARVLADDAQKRVIVVDTSNEIAGDGDIPHSAIGHARRMQVAMPSLQHAVMIEAVENHMPEVIVIDEMGTEADAEAARTIGERGVQLVATAHGNTLDNLVMNPTLSDLVGGVQTVTLGDIEARRRGSQKTVRERRAPPTFDILVEIQGWNKVVVHADVADVVDRMLRGHTFAPEVRTVGEDDLIQRNRQPSKVSNVFGQNGQNAKYERAEPRYEPSYIPEDVPVDDEPLKVTHILPYGVNKGRVFQAIEGTNAPVELVDDINEADLLLTTKNYYRRRTQALRTAEQRGKPVYVLRKNTLPQIQQFIQAITRKNNEGDGKNDQESSAIQEAEEAIARLEEGAVQVDLNPQGAFVRHLQHKIADKYGLASSSAGRDPKRHVVIYKR